MGKICYNRLRQALRPGPASRRSAPYRPALVTQSVFGMESSSMAVFFSSESNARIEPDHFIAHVLTARGLAPHDLDIRQTVLLTFIPELERRLLNALGNPQPNPHAIQ